MDVTRWSKARAHRLVRLTRAEPCWFILFLGPGDLASPSPCLCICGKAAASVVCTCTCQDRQPILYRTARQRQLCTARACDCPSDGRTVASSRLLQPAAGEGRKGSKASRGRAPHMAGKPRWQMLSSSGWGGCTRRADTRRGKKRLCACAVVFLSWPAAASASASARAVSSLCD